MGNLYGSYYCYEHMLEETKLCHHNFLVGPEQGDYGYKCFCYEGFHLCHDGFSCVQDRNEREVSMMRDDSIECNSDAHPLGGKCYSLGEVRLTYPEALTYCQSKNAILAPLNNRDTWWTLGMLIYSKKGQGLEAYYINKNSDFDTTSIHIARHGLSISNDKTAIVANIMDNMNTVPPQFDVTLGLDKLAFFCMHRAGRTEPVETTTAQTTTTLNDLMLNDNQKYIEEIHNVFEADDEDDDNEIEHTSHESTTGINDFEIEPDNVDEFILGLDEGELIEDIVVVEPEEEYDYSSVFDEDEWLDGDDDI